MTLRVNTNVASLNAHKNMIKNDAGLSASLEKLSSGLRINKAADDASGMAIADSLRSQGLGLGQAMRNASDGINMVQTADGALDESIKIVNTIKTKAIQSAQDGQTTESRKAIQADVNKLMEELDIIAKTTSFNGQKLLSGNFTNKKFQVGAYSGETVNISIGSSESTKIGHISTSELTFAAAGTAALSVYSNLQNETYTLNTVDVAYDNSAENSLGAVADAINKLSDVLGISADANVVSTTDSNVVAGTTDATFAINGVVIGAITIQENDSDGALVASINQKTDQHGVYASVDQEGKLSLTSVDNRTIDVTQDSATTAVLGGTADMDTLGSITLTQHGTSEIVINNRAGGMAVALLDDSLLTAGTTYTTVSSSLASGSTLLGAAVGAGSVFAGSVTTSGDVLTAGSSTIGSGSLVNSGSTLAAGTTITGTVNTGAEITNVTGVLGAGSVLDSGSTIGSGTTFTGTVNVSGDTGLTTGTSTLAVGSQLASGTIIKAGSSFNVNDFASGQATNAGNNETYTLSADGQTITFDNDAVLSGGTGRVTLAYDGATLLAGSDIQSGAATSIIATGSTIAQTVMTSSGMTLATDMTLASASILGADTDVTNGTVLDQNVTLGSGLTLTGGDMTLAAGSTLDSASVIETGTSMSNTVYAATVEVVGTMTLAAGSSFATGSDLAEGSSIGGTITTAEAETVDSSTDLLLAAGSTLATGSTITADTMLTNDVVANDGVTYTAGTQLTSDIVTSGTTTLTNAQTLNGGSILAAGSTLTANAAATDSSAVSSTSEAVSYRLSDVNVLTQEGAQIAISVADSALKSLDKVRSDLGSVQNQLTSTISNLSATRVNIFSAESSIRDVDFAEESANFSKMQVLNQASSFAMAQANASSQNVLSLLQG